MEKKHNALGRGLSALIPARTKEQIAREGYFLCPVSRISVNRNQPRKAFREQSIDELAQSIRANGVLQPLLVKPEHGGYELIAGERRLRAAKKAGLKEVPVIIRNVGDTDQLLLSLIENLQREDINPVDEAEGFRKLIEDFGLSQADVAKRAGKDRATVANAVRLLKLPEEIKNALRNNTLSPGHARAILALAAVEEQIRLFRKIQDEKLTVRSAETYAKSRRQKKREPLQNRETLIQINAIESELRKLFTTKIKVYQYGDKGRLEIHYSSIDELDRILGIIRAQ